MKSAKVISLHTYRAGRQRRADHTGQESAGIPLPSSDRLWVLLDRNLNIALWQEPN
jgi:hypothetical protein